jgi:hypothetical protein
VQPEILEKRKSELPLYILKRYLKNDNIGRYKQKIAFRVRCMLGINTRLCQTDKHYIFGLYKLIERCNSIYRRCTGIIFDASFSEFIRDVDISMIKWKILLKMFKRVS